MLQKKRHDTDDSLRVERHKLDGELTHHQQLIADEADAIVRTARSRAFAVIEDARATEDERLEASALASDAGARAEDRATEDAALRDAYRAADERTSHDREGRRRALAVLVDHERAETDERLLLERGRADSALASRDDFLGMVTHDLRNLFAGVGLGAERLVKDAGDDAAGARVRHHALRILHLTTRMNRLVGDLVDVVSIDAHKLTVVPLAGEPTRLLAEMAEAFLASAMGKGIVLTTEVLPGIQQAWFDFDRILQVLANLVSNAIKFTPSGGRIALQVGPWGDFVRFAVTDSGIGIAASKLGAVFERFWQAAGSDRRGLGLGLYISKCIVDAHGGSIGVESAPGAGSTFHFTLRAA